MRVLLVSHNYLHRAPRAKLDALARFDDLTLDVIVPRRWRFVPQGEVQAEPPEDASYGFHSLPTCFAGNEARYMYRSVSLLLTRLEPDIIHVEHGAPALSYFQFLLAKTLFAPRAKAMFFTWVNLDYRLRSHRRWIERYNLRHTDYAIAGNRDAQRILRARGYEGSSSVLPLWGIDKDWGSNAPSDLRRRLGLDGFVVGFAGRLIRQKGLFTLIEAAALLPEKPMVMLIGDGSDRAEIIARADHLGVKLRHVKTLPHARLPGYYRALDAFVLPSLTTPHWKEQFGHVLIEAMACETPVIGSDSGEIPNVIGDAGLIFPEGDAQALAETLRRLLHDEALRRNLARRGRERVLQHYIHGRIAEKTYRIYQQTLAQ